MEIEEVKKLGLSKSLKFDEFVLPLPLRAKLGRRFFLLALARWNEASRSSLAATMSGRRAMSSEGRPLGTLCGICGRSVGATMVAEG